jgi:Icc-related predicted phosphoesterase
MFDNEHVGCRSLAAKLPELKPRLHVFGHIHEAHGAVVKDWESGQKDEAAESTLFVNAANSPVRGGVFGGPGFRPVVVDLLD